MSISVANPGFDIGGGGKLCQWWWVDGGCLGDHWKCWLWKCKCFSCFWPFLAHLSTKFSRWAFVILQCPASVVRRPSVRACVRPSVRQQFLLTTSPLKPRIGFWPNFTGIIPGWSPIKVVQTVSVGCISRSRCQKIGFQNAIFKNLFVQNYKAQSFHI